MTNTKPGDLILATDLHGFTGPAMWGHDFNGSSTLFTPGDHDEAGWTNSLSHPSVDWQAVTVSSLSARIELREDGPVVIVMDDEIGEVEVRVMRPGAYAVPTARFHMGPTRKAV